MAVTKKRKKKTPYRILAATFLATIFFGGALNLIVPDRTYSQEENRNLQKLPEFSMESFSSGRFSQEFESYVNDQFVGRDTWMSIKSRLDRICGKTLFSDVYLGDGALFEEIKTPNEKALSKTITSINDFCTEHADITFSMMLVPNAACIQSDRLPKNAPVRDQNEDIDYFYQEINNRIQKIDLRKTFTEHAEEELYYKTDHHWTSLGAYYAFLQAKDTLGIENAASEYDIYTVSTNFEGTLASRSGIHQFEDDIQIYLPKVETNDYVVEYVDTMTKEATLFQEEKLNQKDQYQVFLGGNHGQISITTTQTSSDVLMILKDSYANSFLPFLTPYYSEIVVVDPRYYTGDLDTLIESKGVDDILFLYNANTLFEDQSLAGVLDYAGTTEEMAKKQQQEAEAQNAADGENDTDAQAEEET